MWLVSVWFSEFAEFPEWIHLRCSSIWKFTSHKSAATFINFDFEFVPFFSRIIGLFFCCCCGIIHRTSSPGGMYGQSFNKFLMNMAQSECQKQKNIYCYSRRPKPAPVLICFLPWQLEGRDGGLFMDVCIYFRVARKVSAREASAK